VKEAAEFAATVGALGFDPEAVLVRDPGVLLDRRFLAALHAEIEGAMGPGQAAITLLQIGFLHGLRDAARVVGSTLEGSQGTPPLMAPSPLAIRFRTNPCARPRGSIELHGCWPNCNEAAAQLAMHRAGAQGGCALSAGYTSGWLSGILDANIVALETSCSAAGDDACRFVAREAEVWRAAPQGGSAAVLEALPFSVLRDLIAEHTPPPAPAAGLDSKQPVIHIWGPVMVVPYSGPDEALMAVDLIGRDPGAAAVSVIVIDLTGAVIDEAFGAAALERIVESIESWGAEAVFAGVSPLSEGVVAGLERQPLVLHKDLHAAIAAAFRIAESQRQLL
jgi:hypothetical protein